MFEGLVRQLILGYLGQYIKDIQKEQLKITLWNEEVLLENVELILEAFDYLQLPFALKHGHVGKLSIKIPWKKLGWDPIIIVLEDVFVSACQRDDKEWSMDEIEKREFAGKKAKLAAAELAKLSRRVCDDRAGKSFTSYITAKILDGIQVSIRNVHVLYRDMLTASAVTVFGMKFSGLTISRQNLVGYSMGFYSGRSLVPDCMAQHSVLSAFGHFFLSFFALLHHGTLLVWLWRWFIWSKLLVLLFKGRFQGYCVV